MKFLISFLFCFCLIWFPVYAQTTISGRVLDSKSGNGMPGVTVMQPETVNGVSSDANGNFAFEISAPSDSVIINISLVGYLTQQPRVAAGCYTTIRLAPDKQIIDCPPIGSGPLTEVGLAGGLRYGPFGGTLKLYGFRRRPRYSFRATIGYQTDFNQNHAFIAALELPPLWRRHDDVCSFNLSETLSYEELRAGAADIRFESYKAMVNTRGFSPLGNLPYRPYFVFLAGGGYAHSQPFILTDAHSTAGFGYSLGLESGFYARQYRRLVGTVQATRWPTFWQWQGRITRTFSSKIKAGLGLNHLQRYTELAVFLIYTFY